MMEPTQKIAAALTLIELHGGNDGSHHKQWVLDQIVRTLTEEGYPQWVEAYQLGHDGPHTYAWDEGIAP